MMKSACFSLCTRFVPTLGHITIKCRLHNESLVTVCCVVLICVVAAEMALTLNANPLGCSRARLSPALAGIL